MDKISVALISLSILKPGTNQATHLSLLSALIRYTYAGTYQFQLRLSQIRVLIFRAVVNGYSAILSDASLKQLQNDPSVAYIDPDYLADISYTISPFQSSTLPARHHARNSLMCSLLGLCTSTPGKNDGTGVDIYGLGERSFHLKIRLPSSQE